LLTYWSVSHAHLLTAARWAGMWRGVGAADVCFHEA